MNASRPLCELCERPRLPCGLAWSRVSLRKRGREMSEARTAKGKIRQGQKESVRPLIPAARIQKRIRAMAKEIRRDFPEERLHLVSVLKGGVFFLTDLAR